MVAIFGFNLHEAYLYVLKALGLKCLCSSLSFESFRAAQYSTLGNAGFKSPWAACMCSSLGSNSFRAALRVRVHAWLQKLSSCTGFKSLWAACAAAWALKAFGLHNTHARQCWFQKPLGCYACVAVFVLRAFELHKTTNAILVLKIFKMHLFEKPLGCNACAVVWF